MYGEAGNDDLQGRSGFDTADYSGLTGGIEVNTADGTVRKSALGTDTLSGIEVIVGTAATDVFYGSAGVDTFYGGDSFDFFATGAGNDIIYGGDDIVYGGDGDDYLVGNAGDDIMYGEAGDDNLQGREGNDTMYGGIGNDQFYGLDGNDTIYGEDGNDFLAGYSGNDVIHGGDGDDRFFGMLDDDTLYGGAGDDFLIANEGNDTVYGDAGNDNLRGRTGNDWLSGGDGNDFILADEGDDTLSGDGGFDTLYGGSGADTFVFEGDWRRDTVGDWSEADTIDLSALGLMGAGETDGQAFARLTLVQSGTTAIISVTGDTRNDIRLLNTDISTIDAGDFDFGPAASPAAPQTTDLVSIERVEDADPSGTALAPAADEAVFDFANLKTALPASETGLLWPQDVFASQGLAERPIDGADPLLYQVEIYIEAYGYAAIDPFDHHPIA